MSWRDEFRAGRAAVEAAANANRQRPLWQQVPVAPSPRYAPAVEDRPPAGEPSPIRIGYYLDVKTRQTLQPNLYYGERHALLFGLNGAGKSTRFLIENLMTLANRSIVVYDLKGELVAQTAAARRRFGRVLIINPFQLHTEIYSDLRSHGFNPLMRLDPASPYYYADVAALAHALIEINPKETQKHWPEGAQGLVMALIFWEVLLARRERRAPSLGRVRQMLCEPEQWEPGPGGKSRLVKGLKITVARMIDEGGEMIASLVEEFMREHGLGEIASLGNAAKVPTRWLIDPTIRADLEKPNPVDLSILRREPTTCYVVLPERVMTEFRPWTRLVISAALREQFRPGPVGTLFVLDEFYAALGHLKIIQDVWSLVRGYGIQLMPILQSVTQLQELFGEKLWQNYPAQSGIVATLGPAGDDETAEWMSRRCGTTTIMQMGFNEGAGVNSGHGVNAGTGVSGGAGGESANQGLGTNYGRNVSDGLSYQQAERRFLLPQELMDLEAGTGRIFIPGMGTRSIPFFAPNYWKRREPWVREVRRNPLRQD